MKTVKYLTIFLAVLTLTACSNGESETRTVESTSASDDKGVIEFEGASHEIEWANCRLSETRWQADTGDSGISIDIDQRANVGSEGYNYYLFVNLIEEPGGPVTRRYYNHWLTTEGDVQVNDGGISADMFIHPRNINQDDVESLKKPVRFSIRC